MSYIDIESSVEALKELVETDDALFYHLLNCTGLLLDQAVLESKTKIDKMYLSS